MTLWPEEHDAQLRIEYRADAPFSEIAEVLNRRFGTAYSRNAVIGRAHRLKLPARKSPIKPKPEAVAPKAKKTDRLRVGPGAQVQAINRGPKTSGDGYKPKTVDVASLDIRLVDLEPMQCRFACVRADDEWRFCGHPVKAGSTYCESHHSLCWNPRVAPTKQAPLYRNEKRRAA